VSYERWKNGPLGPCQSLPPTRASALVAEEYADTVFLKPMKSRFVSIQNNFTPLINNKHGYPCGEHGHGGNRHHGPAQA